MNSQYAVLIDLGTGEILAQKKPGALVSPASMTKILTILTAAEHIGGPPPPPRRPRGAPRRERRAASSFSDRVYL